MGKDSGYLFASRELRTLLDERRDALTTEVEGLDSDRLLNTSPADLARYLVEKYTLEVPCLRREEWSADESESQVDVRHDSNRWITDRSQPVYIPSQRIEIEVPFDGEPELLYARPSTFSSSSPRARIRGKSLFLEFNIPHDVQRDIRQDIEGVLAEIERHLIWVTNDVAAFNSALLSTANSAIESRRQRLLSNQGRVASLGIPLKSRADIPKTFAIPTVRKKVTPKLPEASSVPYEPEPTLDMENYNHILDVIQNMALVMERSPSAFLHMGEEDLRQHFLVQLNGQFEGNATGETFNVGGKTDILLRYNGKNAFIAECKFWKGPKHFEDTIDQLLGYTAWRDTKTAILVFNRGTGLSTVLDGINRTSANHPNYKRTEDWRHETGFRYVFHQHGDVNRELILTALVFDVPS